VGIIQNTIRIYPPTSLYNGMHAFFNASHEEHADTVVMEWGSKFKDNPISFAHFEFWAYLLMKEW
jgi:hypothetical protein